MTVRIRPFDTADAPLAAAWLAADDNCKWLDFGRGVRTLNEIALRMMAQRDLHALYIYAAQDGRPIGIVALSEIDRSFGTAGLWYVLGDKRHGGRGRTTLAAMELLHYGFKELQLRSIYAWAVASNGASVRVLQKCGFRLIGRRRRCHVVDGRMCDRLLFDVLPDEMSFSCGAAGSGRPIAPQH